MFKRKKSVINRPIRIIVSEPWDFDSQDGENVLIAEVVSIFEMDNNEEQWLLKSKNRLNMKAIEGFYCFARAREHSEPLANLRKGKSVDINLALVPEKNNADALRGDDSTSVFVIIGSAKLE
jgi:hypothetical protein